MFQAGDLIVYGNTGVCKVEGFAKPNLPGVDRNKEYYVLTPLYQEGTIYSPTDNTKVFMRPVISKNKAEELINMIPSIQAQSFHTSSSQQLTEHYQGFFNSHDCSDLIELIMSIYAKKQYLLNHKHKFGQIDERFMRKAEELLHGELAVALGISLKEVPGYIASRVETANNSSEIDLSE